MAQRGVSPYSRFPPPTSSCSLQAKPRWVHVKDHMTIGIPDPARDREWIRPNSTMSQAPWDGAADITNLDTQSSIVWQLPAAVPCSCSDQRCSKFIGSNTTEPKGNIKFQTKTQLEVHLSAVSHHQRLNINGRPLRFLSVSSHSFSDLQHHLLN